ncbi:alpha-2-glucosyltransferase Alg10 [Lipomyces arxii]|uniref:alpha-2-glucosyltransferase Alg10 n=1 Tax=Lipomyces arxii TaxID=56418 RepID=UPI0034D01D1C
MLRLVQVFTIVVTGAIFAAVNQVVVKPYLDEIFHIPQTIRYYNGNWSYWDPKITTPPGLYILAVAYAKILSLISTNFECNVRVLRSFNLIGQLVFLPWVLSLFPLSHHSLSARTTVMLQLLPPLYFFTFLYYTDMWSTIFALLSVALALRSTRASWISVVVKMLVGTMAIALRQTNVIWVSYAFAVEILTVLVYPDEKGKDRADDAWFMAASAKLEDVSAPSDLIRAGVGAIVRVWRALRGNKRSKALKILCSYSFTIGVFLLFAIANGGITLGDKDNHVAGIHLPQLFYFSTFACVLSIPTIFPVISQTFNILVYRPFTFAIATSIIIVAIYTTTVAHPFILADNRHYTFYLWRKCLNATPWSRYLFAPGYGVALYIIFARAVRKGRILTSVVFFCACAAVLIPSPLIECRYYIVPYMIWRMRVAILNAEGLDTRRENKVGEYVEIFWYMIINAITIGLFLGYSFEWPSEPGIAQRFMW